MPGRLFSLWITLALTSVCHAEIYTWTDASGNQHFSDTPPDQPAKSVELGPISIVPMNENIQQGARISELRESFDERPTQRNPSERRDSERIKRQCEQYRNTLDKIQQQLRAGYSNDRGNRLRRKRREMSQRLARECLLG